MHNGFGKYPSRPPFFPAPPPVKALSLSPVNANVHSVHLADGTHVGNLKRVGEIWKFKAIGYGVAGAVEPGGGPFTDRHNTPFAAADAQDVTAKLCA
mgnify:FL=1